MLLAVLRSRLLAEKTNARAALLPCLQAEEDRTYEPFSSILACRAHIHRAGGPL